MDKYGPFPKAWYNRLGIEKVYQSTNPKDKWFHFSLASHDDEDNIQKNFLTIAIGTTYKKFKLPFQLIKPLFDYNTYEYDGKDYYQLSHKKLEEMGCPIKYKNYVQNEYRLYINKEAVCLHLNDGEFLYNDSKHKPLIDFYWFIPWNSRIRTKDLLLNLDGSLFYDCSEGNWDSKNEKEKEQESTKFLLQDYDGTNVVVTCTLSYSEYSMGSNKKWARLLKPFNKPNCYYTVDLSFGSEVGTGKGSWKGGTVGHAVNLLSKDETIEEAVKRYCNNSDLRGSRMKDLKFLGAYDGNV